ncbi:MAG: helix-turn-helix domain-containing protein [Firmicutes bacterium]|nr:helix-turn-helix domain-containing protein [Bacillota bacterium]
MVHLNSCFADRLSELRRERSLTLIQMEKETGISKASINGWENKTRIPRHDFVIKLAQYFGVSIDYMSGAEQ